MTNRYKRYKSTSDVEYNFYVRVDNEEIPVSFRGASRTVTVTDPKIAAAIELSEYYTSGKVKLVHTQGDWGPLKVDANMAASLPDPETDESPTKQEESTSNNVSRYPDIRNLGDAQQLLINEYNVDETEIIRKVDVLAKAKELGIRFPNYR